MSRKQPLTPNEGNRRRNISDWNLPDTNRQLIDKQNVDNEWDEFADDQHENKKKEQRNIRSQSPNNHRCSQRSNMDDMEVRLHEIQESMNQINLINRNNQNFDVHDGASIPQILTSANINKIKSDSLGKLSKSSFDTNSPAIANMSQHSNNLKVKAESPTRMDRIERKKSTMTHNKRSVFPAESLSVEDQKMSFGNEIQRKLTLQEENSATNIQTGLKMIQRKTTEILGLNQDSEESSFDKYSQKTDKDDKIKRERMKERNDRKCGLLYPEDAFASFWDPFVVFLLFINCILMPYMIAFENKDLHWHIISLIIDILFVCDILIIFCTAFYDEDFQIIEDRFTIAMTYFKSGWLFIDIVAIFPFDILNGDHYFLSDGDSGGGGSTNQVIRIARIGRLYKIIKLMKLIRLVRIAKEKAKIFKYATDILKLGEGMARLLFFAIVSFMVIHIISCLWVFFAGFEEDFKGTWMDNDEIRSMQEGDIYLVAVYFAVTTITTVGYGDISANNGVERVFCLIVMIIGVTLFTTAASTITQIMSSYDETSAKFQERAQILNRVYHNYCLPLELYDRVKKSLAFQYQHEADDIIEFLEELPKGLQVEVSMFVYENIYKKIAYLQVRSSSFIAWICPNLKPIYQLQQEYIYFEGDDITYIYFLNEGECGFVLPRHNNVRYVRFEQGCTFGLIDVIGSVMKYGIEFDEWMQYPEKMKRQFTVRSQTNCELLTISVKDLERMKYEFNQEYNTLFDNKVVRLNNVLKLKIQTIQQCNEVIKDKGIKNDRGILTLPDDFKPDCQGLTQVDSLSMEEESLEIDLVTSKSFDDTSQCNQSDTKGKNEDLEQVAEMQNGKIQELKALERKNTSQGIHRQSNSQMKIIKESEHESDHSNQQQLKQSDSQQASQPQNQNYNVQKASSLEEQVLPETKINLLKRRNSTLNNSHGQKAMSQILTEYKEMKTQKMTRTGSFTEEFTEFKDKQIKSQIIKDRDQSSDERPGDVAFQRYKAETRKKGMNDRQAEEASRALLEKIKTNIREEKLYNTRASFNENAQQILKRRPTMLSNGRRETIAGLGSPRGSPFTNTGQFHQIYFELQELTTTFNEEQKHTREQNEMLISQNNQLMELLKNNQTQILEMKKEMNYMKKQLTDMKK